MPPVWRSLLYVPANNRRFIEKAHTRNADGIILDLEDGVPPAERPGAREMLNDSVAKAAGGGADVLVRVNAGAADLDADLEAAAIPGVTALVVPKAESAEQIHALSARVSALEASRGMKAGAIRLLVLIESPAGLLDARAIAAADDRIIALSLGSEDFALQIGMVADEESLLLPKQWTLYAARAAGVVPLGLVGSIAAYSDVDALKRIAVRSSRLGFEGASCIHPSAVPVLNDAFTPTEEEVAGARRVVTAYDAAVGEGKGALQLDGKMIDAPVAERAARLLSRWEAIAQRRAST
jgi:citrate lyase subunit beta/citryl-CoA lyase